MEKIFMDEFWKNDEVFILTVFQRLIDGGAPISSYKELTDKTLLFIAASRGCDRVVKLLFENGADLNSRDKDGWTPLSIAVNNGYVKVVKFLIEAGASHDIKYPLNNLPALSLASANNKTDIVEYLIEKGVDVNARDDLSQTALMLACANDNADVVRILLKNGADTEISDNKGQTPLIVTSGNNFKYTTTILLKAGANIDAITNDGETPLTIARYRGLDLIVELLSIEKAKRIKMKESLNSLFTKQNGN